MTNPANIQSVQAKQLKNGKYEFTAILQDGSQEIIKKAGVLKPFVNVYDQPINGNAKIGTAGVYCTYNNEPGVLCGWQKYVPIKSIEVQLI